MGGFTPANDTEPVSVTIKRPLDREGFTAFLYLWTSKYPEGVVSNICAYGELQVTLRLPPGTTVQVPALIDATAKEEDAGSKEQKAD